MLWITLCLQWNLHEDRGEPICCCNQLCSCKSSCGNELGSSHRAAVWQTAFFYLNPYTEKAEICNATLLSPVSVWERRQLEDGATRLVKSISESCCPSYATVGVNCAACGETYHSKQKTEPYMLYSSAGHFSSPGTRMSPLIESSADICLGSRERERDREEWRDLPQRRVWCHQHADVAPRENPKQKKSTFPSLGPCRQSSGGSGSPQHPNESRNLRTLDTLFLGS